MYKYFLASAFLHTFLIIIFLLNLNINNYKKEIPKIINPSAASISSIKVTMAIIKSPPMKENKNTNNIIPNEAIKNIKTLTEEVITAEEVLTGEEVLQYNTLPKYPKKSIENKEQGTVIINLVVDNNGKIKKVILHQSSGYPLLDQSTITTAKNWEIKQVVQKNTLLQIKVHFVLK